MGVEVVIPAYKPDEKLNRLIDRLNNQTVLPDKITIVLSIDSDSDIYKYKLVENESDSKVELVIDYVLKELFGHGKTRQYYLERSCSDYVLFMTQDAVPYDDSLIEHLIEKLSQKDIAVAYSRQLPFSDANPIERFSRLYNYPSKSSDRSASDLKKLGVKAIFCSDTCAMYNKDLAIKLGGFDIESEFGEDALFAFKALQEGYYVSYCADAKVFHSHNYSASQEFKRSRIIAVSQMKHPEIYRQLKSENEGIRYFLKGFRYFCSKHQYINVILLFKSCAVKYLGYFAGKHFDKYYRE